LGVGSELISSAALEKADMSSITSLARQYVTVVQQVRETMKPALV